jgi:tetratricopeptide (TPR) repeat protein
VRRSIWHIIAISIALFSSASPAHAQTEAWDAVFFKANEAYKKGDFEEAAKRYNALIRSGHANGHIYYNLGNAYFRQNRLGHAILNYERARLLMPRDADLNFNLSQAYGQIQDAIPKSRGFISMTFFWLESLSLQEVFWGFAFVNVLFWAVLLVRFFWRSDWTYYLFLILIIFWLISGLSFGVKWHMIRTDSRAVILTKKLNVLAGPHVQDTLLFKLHEGAIVNHERSEDGWALIRLPGQKRGWVKAEAIGRIR